MILLHTSDLILVIYNSLAGDAAEGAVILITLSYGAQISDSGLYAFNSTSIAEVTQVVPLSPQRAPFFLVVVFLIIGFFSGNHQATLCHSNRSCRFATKPCLK